MVHPRVVGVKVFLKVQQLVLQREATGQEEEAREEVYQSDEVYRVLQDSKFAPELVIAKTTNND